MRLKLKLILIIILIINSAVNIQAEAAAQAHLEDENNKIKIAAADPWLAVITSFIGGTNVYVTSLYDFNAKPNKNVNLNNINKLIAIDRDELKNFKININIANIETWYLFKEFKELNNLEAAILDPSVTPFIAQKIMTALATWDAANYPYYQRRLAEFQTRLSSSILAGKQLLNGTKIYLDGEGALNLYNLFKASGCEILDKVTPDALSIVDDSYSRGKRKLKSQGNIFYFKRPDIKENNYNIDYPAYLHDLYIALWQLISKSN